MLETLTSRLQHICLADVRLSGFVYTTGAIEAERPTQRARLSHYIVTIIEFTRSGADRHGAV